MFDQQTPSDLPVEDIFEKMENKPAAAGAPVSSAPIAPPRPPMAPPQPMAPKPATPPVMPITPQSAPVIMQTPGQGWKKVLMVVGVIIVLGAGGFAAWYFVFNKPQGTAKVPEAQAPAQNVPQAAAPQPEVIVPTTTPVAVDSDNDGLTDEEELRLGTDPHNPDTDGDGLFDGEEVKVYHTNPLDKDTDKDGYTDGEEVTNGYNPLGPGKLFVVPPAAGSTTTK